LSQRFILLIKMAQIIDMKFMRYINLFSKICHVSTTNCFVYNNQIIFAVPKKEISVALGKKAMNVKKMSETLRKKIKVIEMPKDETNIKKFVEDLVSPVEFNNLEVKGSTVFISADRQGKAMLIGRNRIREKELSVILEKAFKITKLRIG